MTRPDTFLVGAPKCATTALGHWLAQHPDVFFAAKRDLHFFGADLEFRDQRIDERTYLAQFAGATNEARVAESSVWYLLSERAAEEIARFCPGARIVIALRNPAEVIAAHHSQMLVNGLGDEDILDLEQALAAENDRRAGRQIPPECRLPQALHYREVARFAPQVRRYLDRFPREQIHFVLLDDLKTNPAATYQALLTFLGLDPTHAPSFDHVNANQVVRAPAIRALLRATPSSWKARLPKPVRLPARRLLRRAALTTQPRPAMQPNLREALLADMADEIRELSVLLKRDLSHWLTQPP